MVLPIIASGVVAGRVLLPKILPFAAKKLGSAVRFIAPKTTKGVVTTALGVPLGIGVLSVSPTARSFLNPFKGHERGKKIGEFIEDPSSIFPEQPKAPSLSDIIKGLGLAGLGGATVVGGLKIIETIREKETIIKEPAPIIPTQPLPATPSITQATQPIGAVQPDKPKSIDPMKITNTFKPSIDIKISKSRRFINQQINIKNHGRRERR